MWRIFAFAVLLTMGISSHSQNPCSGDQYELVKPFLGTWKEFTVTDTSEVFIGTLNTQLILNGCGISQRFISADSTFSYQSLGYVDDRGWRETYIFSNGNFAVYEWRSDDEGVITERISGSRKIEYAHRLRLTNITDQSYDVYEEHSTDDWKTWETVELTLISKIK